MFEENYGNQMKESWLGHLQWKIFKTNLLKLDRISIFIEI